MADAEAVRSIQQAGAWVSAVSIWEMAIKHGLGKLPLPSRQIVAEVGAQGSGWLNITPAMPRRTDRPLTTNIPSIGC